MKKLILLMLSVLMLVASLTACGGSESGSSPASTGSKTSGMQTADSIQNEEKPPLVIYRTSEDEIELHFTSEALETVEDVIFLAPDSNGSQNPAVILTLEQYDGATHPSFRIYTDAAYTIDEYNGEMEYSIENDTLICHIRHENIAAVFHKVTLWHIDNAKPVSFEGVMTDDLTGAVYKPLEKGVLPAEYKSSEYDDQYFTPDSDDFIVISYEQPVVIFRPVWYTEGVYVFGRHRDENQYESIVKVTCILSFDGDIPISTKIRAEYPSAEDAKLASLSYDSTICPSELGYPNEPNDDLVTEDFYLQADQMLYGKLKDRVTSTLAITYHGLFDHFRYFEFDRQEDRLEYLDFVPLSDYTSSLNIPFLSLSYQAGETVTQSVDSQNYTLTIYSTKKTYEAGSDSSVLDAIYQLSGDGAYFSPKTEDYAYVIYSNYTDDYEDGTSDFNQVVSLFAFDEQGNLVQCISRMYDSYFLQDSFVYKDYMPDFSEEDWTHVVYDENENVFYEDIFAMNGREPIDIYEGLTAKQSLQNDLTENGQNEGYYFSKP